MEGSRRRKRKRSSSNSERRVLTHFPHYKDLKFGECIGHGHFSHVYKGWLEGRPVAIKVIERGSSRLVKIETKILKKLKGVDHVVQLLKVIKSEETLLVFELLDGISEDEVLDRITVRRLRRLLRAVLMALHEAHSRGIVHRDVKLGNIVVSNDFRDVKLIDWGCGIFVNNDMNPKAGSRQFRPPEMLLGYGDYGTKCDVWAVGAVILYILSGGRIPWRARTSTSALIKMSAYFGGNAIDQLAEKIDCELDEEIDDELYDEPKHTLESCFDRAFDDLCVPDLIDLMKTLMTVDMDARPTAHMALQHKFFQVPD